MPFFVNTVQKRFHSMQFIYRILAFRVVNEQAKSELANQMRALDGAIYGAIFLWMRDTHALLLFNPSTPEPPRTTPIDE